MSITAVLNDRQLCVTVKQLNESLGLRHVNQYVSVNKDTTSDLVFSFASSSSCLSTNIVISFCSQIVDLWVCFWVFGPERHRNLVSSLRTVINCGPDLNPCCYNAATKCNHWKPQSHQVAVSHHIICAPFEVAQVSRHLGSANIDCCWPDYHTILWTFKDSRGWLLLIFMTTWSFFNHHSSSYLWWVLLTLAGVSLLFFFFFELP